MDFHQIHCSNCFQSGCSNENCKLIECSHCRVNLHECKLSDHLESICRKNFVDCPNKLNGCVRLVLREKIGNHLVVCPASIVVCVRDRCRKIVGKDCKLDLKKVGKKGVSFPVISKTPPSNILDIELAKFDQNVILKSYDTSRKTRVRQRDPLHPYHPLLPLRNISFDDSRPGPDDIDSSEDELREKREKLKKSRLVFSNCYMCQIDPSVQHLHTLGNGIEMERSRKKRMTPKKVDEFHKKHGLKVNVTVENVPECSIKGENVREIKKGGTIYTFKCLKTVRRSEFHSHSLSQHTLTTDQLDLHILRCPNWSRGCDFFTKRIQPKCGTLRFNNETCNISHHPNEENEIEIERRSSTKWNLENLPLWVFETLENYLPSSSLYNLSTVSRNLRQNIFLGCQNSCYVEANWHKLQLNGGWCQNQFEWKFSTAEPAADLQWRVPVELSHHLPSCKYFDSVEYNQTMMSVFPKQLENDIWHGFCDALSHRTVRQLVAQM